jgi:hypothetical protein
MVVGSYLWQIYCDPYFDFHAQLSSDHYAIITGWNRYGEKQSHQDNQLQNERLYKDLPLADIAVVYVGNQDFSWYEESYAVGVSKCKARTLATEFAQNAFYYVSHGELTLLSCLDDNEYVIGPIKGRCCKIIT